MFGVGAGKPAPQPRGGREGGGGGGHPGGGGGGGVGTQKGQETGLRSHSTLREGLQVPCSPVGKHPF